MSDPVLTASGAAAKALAPAIDKTLDKLGSKISEQLGKLSQSVVDRTVVSFRLGFKDYLKTSYARCRYFKTILNQNQPIEVAKGCVHVTLTCDKKKYHDDKLIEEIEKLKFLVITGLAGSGKSMFMKYLTICKFEKLGEKVPLFVELRQINSLTEQDLRTLHSHFLH